MMYKSNVLQKVIMFFKKGSKKVPFFSQLICLLTKKTFAFCVLKNVFYNFAV